MEVVEKSQRGTPQQRQRVFLRLLFTVALVVFAVGYASSAGAHPLDRPSHALMVPLVSTPPGNCPCPDCDHGADACCCISACSASSVGVIALGVLAPTANGGSPIGFGDHTGIAGAVPSPLFHPPKLVVPA